MQDSFLIKSVTTIAKRLAEAREAKGLTQESLARTAGVAQGTIGNIESGTRNNPRELLAIAAAVGVAPEWLKTGKGQREIGTAAPTPARTAEADRLAQLCDSIPDERERYQFIGVVQAYADLAIRGELSAMLDSLRRAAPPLGPGTTLEPRPADESQNAAAPQGQSVQLGAARSQR